MMLLTVSKISFSLNYQYFWEGKFFSFTTENSPGCGSGKNHILKHSISKECYKFFWFYLNLTRISTLPNSQVNIDSQYLNELSQCRRSVTYKIIHFLSSFLPHLLCNQNLEPIVLYDINNKSTLQLHSFISPKSFFWNYTEKI